MAPATVAVFAEASCALFGEGALDQAACPVAKGVLQRCCPLLGDLLVGDGLVDLRFPGCDDRVGDITDGDAFVFGDCFD